MRKWEYNIFNRRGAPWHEILKEINELGGRGWEMIASDFEVREEGEERILYYHAIFKRQIID